MNITRRIFVVATLACCLSTPLLPTAASANDPTFVGVLAYAVEKDVVAKLKLSDETVGKLQELIAKREKDANALVLSIRDLSPAEASKRLDPFVEESERLGMELLSLEQRELLNKVRIARGGMDTLTDNSVSQILQLSAEQKEKIQKLLDDRAKDLAGGDERTKRITRALYEQRLASVLSEPQYTSWKQLAGLEADDGPQRIAQAEDKPEEATGDEKPPAPEPAKVAESNPDNKADDAKPAAEEKPAEPARVADVPSPSDRSDGKLYFNFEEADWKDVLEWFAEKANKSLQYDESPPGTFSFQDRDPYTPAEALDRINSVLLRKGFTLVELGRMLFVLNREDDIPPELVPLVDVAELDDLGAFSQIKCLYQLTKMTAEDCETELRPLLGPGQSMVVLPKSRQVLVTELSGKQRVIRDTIKAIEDPDSKLQRKVVEMTLKHVLAEDVLEIARPLLGLEEGLNTNEAINIATDAYGRRVFATGTDEAVARLEEIVAMVDQKPSDDVGPDVAVITAEIRTYPISAADPEATLQVLQTLLAGLPDARMALDQLSNKLIVMARPDDHKIVVETLQKLEGEAPKFQSIALRRLDPELVIATINKMFGLGEEGADGPKVDADPVSMRLFVRGTETEINQIRELVKELESQGEYASDPNQGNIRMIPLMGDDAADTLRQLQAIWSTFSDAEIEIVPSSALSPSLIEEREVTPRRPEPETPESPADPTPPATPPAATPKSSETTSVGPLFAPSGDVRVHAIPEYGALLLRGSSRDLRRTTKTIRQLEPVPYRPKKSGRKTSSFARISDTYFVSTDDESPEAGEEKKDSQPAPKTESTADAPAKAEPKAATAPPATAAAAQPKAPPATAPAKRKPKIYVSLTPRGIMIASNDPKALNDFEGAMRALAPPVGADTGLGYNRQIVVFYLRHAKADVAAKMVVDIMGGVAGGSLVDDVTAGLTGGGGFGGFLGAMMGGGGGGGGNDQGGSLQTVGGVDIVPDARLNRLVIQGTAEDIALVEQILKIVDKENSITDIETDGVPHLIPVVYTSAAKVVELVKQAFPNSVAQSNTSGRQQQQSPQDLIRQAMSARSGGGRGGRGGQNQTTSEAPKMTITVHEESNSIVVVAPEQLYQKVQRLVETVDQPNTLMNDSVEVLTVNRANPELIQKALASILGAKTGSSTTNSQGSSTSGGASSTTAADIQRRAEFFQRLQSGGFRPGGFGATSGRGSTGRGGTPFGGRGGTSPFGGRGASGGRGGRGR